LFNARRFNVAYDGCTKIKRAEQSCEKLDAFMEALPSRQPDAE
jgi:hypothetical protein